MPIYHRLGELPPKRHTQFRRPDGGLYTEELFGTAGFSGCSSILYHYRLPTAATATAKGADLRPEPWPQEAYHHHHLRSKDIAPSGDALSGRQVLLFNSDVSVAVVRPAAQMGAFYRN